MDYTYEKYDVAVIGAGHAGCEAALACARLGLKTIMFTVSMDSIAMMPCNPNIGGTSKGHLVKELDALGGEMGKNIDRTFIQSKMLNGSKGPAVHSLRAQADKRAYTDAMRKVVENQEDLTLKQAEVTEILTENGKVSGVKIVSGCIYPCTAAILCTGVYLNARCIYGETSVYTGPNGLPSANHLTDSLRNLGIEIMRFKTGTPARIDKRSIDFSVMEEQKGDEKLVPFSFTNEPEDIAREQVYCYLTHTNQKTHDIIRANIHRSPLFSGAIKGTGPRYCPSIEDKVVKFADKESHQVFIEPEGLYTNEMYISGMSSSLPEDVQEQMYRSVKGLENAKIVRNAYAIEYDLINPIQLKPSLELKNVENLFSAGQANGSSGYEEAAVQGLMAGINAARKLTGKEPVVLDRSQGYIGVLIDDLVTKETKEPYRMMTSRAEYRLLLRQDNADLRLTEIGYEIGLIDEERYQKFVLKRKHIEDEIERLSTVFIGERKEVFEYLEKKNSAALKSGISLSELLQRPELNYDDVIKLEKLATLSKESKNVSRETSETKNLEISNKNENADSNAKVDEVTLDVLNDLRMNELTDSEKEQVEIEIKYKGYIVREAKQVEAYKKMEVKKIPADIDYDEIQHLRIEARQKLKLFRPENVGQASRISGVSPSDIAVLLVYLGR